MGRKCSRDRPTKANNRWTGEPVKNFLGGAIAVLSAAAAFQLLGQAQQPTSPATGKDPALTPAQSTAPAGGSANADTKKGKGRGRGPARPQGPTPRLSDGRVDLSGVWNGGGPIGDVAQGLMSGETIEMTAEGKKVFESRDPRTIPRPIACRPASRASLPIPGASSSRQTRTSFSCSRATFTASDRSS